MRWHLTGTANQQSIAREAFNRIHFPFDRLAQLPGTPELGWRDLNSGLYAGLIDAADEKARGHSGHQPMGDDRIDPLVGEVEGRRWVMGVIYTQSGRIYLDVRLEQRPALAMAVVAAEIGHAVDFFLPMNDDQRNELLRLWGRGGTWWEVYDYGREYFGLGGEAFMHEFVAAYTDLDFGDKSAFLHDIGVEPADVRRILGIERTDAVQLIHYPRSGRDIFHKPTHRYKYPEPLASTEGFRACKVCKP